jgi:hypothetical protein
MRKTKHLLVGLAGMLLLPVGVAGAAPASAAPAPGGFDYTAPSAPRDVAGGTFLGVVGTGLRLVRVENPSGAPGCEGAPRPDLRAVTAGGSQGDLFDPAPQVTLSAGGNTVLSAGAHVAIVTFCEGFAGPVWLATASGTQLTDVRALPALNPAPTGQFRVTGLSGDGQRLLAVHTTGSSLDEHRAVAVDTTSGAVSDLGVPGYWVGELAGGTLVVDQGDHLRIGDVTVPVAGPPDGGKSLAISPDGERVAVGNEAGVVVVDRDGTSCTWTTDAVRGGGIAWSPDGVALAYATGPADAIEGELRVVTASSSSRTVAPSVVTYVPVGFSDDGATAALIASAPNGDAGDPAVWRITEVTFPRLPALPLPTSPVAYAEATFAAWQGQDRPALERLAQPGVVDLLTARPPRAGETWTGPSCEGAAGSTYCSWSSSDADLVIRVGNEAAAGGEERAVTEAFFTPPAGGVAVWPLTTAEEAANTQQQVDEGHSPWMLEPAAVADAFARAELGWDDVTVTVLDASTIRVARGDGSSPIVLAVGQPARTGAGGIWAITRVGSTSG